MRNRRRLFSLALTFIVPLLVLGGLLMTLNGQAAPAASADPSPPQPNPLLEAIRQGEPAALATVIEAQGSTPRDASAKMLVYADGRTVGTVGGGGVEARVIDEAKAALAQGQSRELTYELVDEERGAGQHVVIWTGRDTNGRPLPAGVYFSQLIAGEYVQARKLVLVRRR